MTIIVYKDDVVVVDRLCLEGDIKTARKKYEKNGGDYLFCTGSISQGYELFDWYINDAKREHWPSFQNHSDFSRLFVFDGTYGTTILEYEHVPHPLEYKRKDVIAAGSGREIALGALYAGADAVTAAKAACHYSSSCGIGLDVVDLKNYTVDYIPLS